MTQHTVTFTDEFEEALVDGGTMPDLWLADIIAGPQAGLLQSYRAKKKIDLMSRIDRLPQEEIDRIITTITNNEASLAAQVEPTPVQEVKAE